MGRISREAAITGVGETAFAKALPGRTGYSLATEASLKAIGDAGLKTSDIDGVITGGEVYRSNNPKTHLDVADQLGIYAKRFSTSVAMGGATAGFCVELARWAVATGRCRNVLIASGVHISASAPASAVGGGAVNFMAQLPHHSVTYEQTFGTLIATFYAAMAQRHMHEFGTTSEQLAEIAVACRHHASMNPNAVMRQPITVDDVLNSRMICSPLHLLDCCISNDGGAAMVISSAEVAQDTAKPPIWILGTGYAQSYYFVGKLSGGSAEGFDLVRTVAREAGKMALGEAGVRPHEIDVAELYDSFTITVLEQLEDYGFCRKGEGGSFVENGSLKVGGRLPLNTYGGHMSGSMIGGFMHPVEAVHQLRGECGDRQVADAKLALVSSVASVASTYSVQVLGRN